MTFLPVELVVLLIILAGVLGLLIGSFLNVVVWRLPRGESLSHPGSACPKCGHSIRWWDNIPVFSWLALRAKCRDCGEPISGRYPAVEAFTGLFFAGIAMWVLAGALPVRSEVATIVAAASFLYLAAISVALTLIDLDIHKLPNKIVVPAYVVGIVTLGAASVIEGGFDQLIRAALGGAILFVAYFVMAIVYPGGMGFGDVKLAGVLGMYLAWLGWGQLAVGAFAAFVLGGLFSLALIVLRRVNRKSGIPFGPWMLAGAWLGTFAGGIIASSYLALFDLGM